ncbi:hypothetical protein AB0H83_03985 [Dactylosporangium sp. NPDC050688]|uniref:hypothetical protein n=1 Tax=Dactylosporangium sp. NPDC050688 TaxID=3157217 RepID=UPI00340236C0
MPLRGGQPYRAGAQGRRRTHPIRDRQQGQFAHITDELADGTTLPLCRPRYGGYANRWGFVIYLASKDGYEDSLLPNGSPVGTA